MKIWPVKLIKVPQWLWLLSILRRWFCCCLFIVYCCSHCFWRFSLRFVLQYFVTFLVVQSFLWGRESWLLYFCCVLNVMSLLSFFGSSSQYNGLVCRMWLWHFLVLLTWFWYLSHMWAAKAQTSLSCSHTQSWEKDASLGKNLDPLVQWKAAKLCLLRSTLKYSKASKAWTHLSCFNITHLPFESLEKNSHSFRYTYVCRSRGGGGGHSVSWPPPPPPPLPPPWKSQVL